MTNEMKLRLAAYVLYLLGILALLSGLVLYPPSAFPIPLLFLIYIVLPVLIVLMAMLIIRTLNGTLPKDFGATEHLNEMWVFLLLRSRPAFIAPAVTTTLLPLAFLILFFTYGARPFFSGIAAFTNQALLLAGVSLEPGTVFAGLLACMFFFVIAVFLLFQVWGMLIAGELLQRYLSGRRQDMAIHMAKNTFRALPYVLAWTFFFILFLFLRPRRSEDLSFSDVGVTVFSVGGLIAIKYSIYTHLAALAFEDRYERSARNGVLRFLAENREGLLRVFVGSASVFLLFLLYFCAGMAWSDVLPVFQTKYALLFGIGLFALIFCWMRFVEQMLFLLTYIKARHPSHDIHRLLG